MTYLLHMLMGMLLIVFQTTIRPQIGILTGIYDVMIAYVLFLGLFRPVKEALVMTLVFLFFYFRIFLFLSFPFWWLFLH